MLLGFRPTPNRRNDGTCPPGRSCPPACPCARASACVRVASRPRAAPRPIGLAGKIRDGEGGQWPKMPDYLDNQLARLNSYLPSPIIPSIGLFSKKTTYQIDAADKNYGSSLSYVGRLNCNFPSLRYIISMRFFVVLKPLALLFAD